MEHNDLKKLLEENLKVTKEIYKMSKSIKSYLAWQRIFGVVKILLIVAPIVFGLIFLPPLLKDLQEQYKPILNLEGGGINSIFDLLKNPAIQNIDIDKLPPEAQKYLK